jgi:tetratricopeptide (TPR) repeat protein
MTNWDDMWNDPSFKGEEDPSTPKSFDLGIPNDDVFKQAAWKGKTAYSESYDTIDELEHTIKSRKSPEQIEALARKAIAASPDFKQELSGILANSLIQMKRFDEADAIARKALRENPTDSLILSYRGTCALENVFADLGSDKKEYKITKLKQAVEFFSKALEFSPSDTPRNITLFYEKDLGNAFCTLYREVNGVGILMSHIVEDIFVAKTHPACFSLNDLIEKYGREELYERTSALYQKGLQYLNEAYATLKKHDIKIGEDNSFFSVTEKLPELMRILEANYQKRIN